MIFSESHSLIQLTREPSYDLYQAFSDSVSRLLLPQDGSYQVPCMAHRGGWATEFTFISARVRNPFLFSSSSWKILQTFPMISEENDSSSETEDICTSPLVLLACFQRFDPKVLLFTGFLCLSMALYCRGMFSSLQKGSRGHYAFLKPQLAHLHSTHQRYCTLFAMYDCINVPLTVS